MRAALFILSAAATVLAWRIGTTRPQHRPIAWALSVHFGASVVRALILSRFPANPDPSAPQRTGAALAALYVSRALFIAWPYALAAAAVHVLARRRAWPVALVYIAAVGLLVLGYGWLRFDALRKAYLALELVALAIGLASVAKWYAAGWRRERAGKPEPVDFSGRIAAGLVLGHFATVVTGPYRFGLFGEAWAIAQLAYVVVLAVLILLQLLEVLTHAEP